MSKTTEKETLSIDKSRGLLGWFLILTFLYSTPFYWLIIQYGGIGLYIIGLMWAPGLAALTSCKAMGVSNRILGWSWGKNKYHWLSYFLPLGYVLFIYGMANALDYVAFINEKNLNQWGDVLGLNGWATEEILWMAVPVIMTITILKNISYALGEELGWRGLLAPQLLRLFPFPVAATLSGLIWFAWHLPVILWGGYNSGYETLNAQILNFGIMMVALSFPLLYIRIRSGSVWTSAIFHGAHNMALFSLVSVLFLNTDPNSKYYVGEWSIFIAITTSAIALYTWYLVHKNGLEKDNAP